MTKASDNEFPKVILDVGTIPAAPSDGNWKLYAAAGGVYAVSSNATVGPLAAGRAGGAVSLLAVHSYDAGSDTAAGTTTGDTLVDLDATNAAITFTAPASGNVLVRLSGLQTGGPGNVFWGLREGSGDIGAPVRLGLGSSTAIRAAAEFYLTGVSAGSHTYKWAHKAVAGGATTSQVFTGPSIGPLVMEVYGAP